MRVTLSYRVPRDVAPILVSIPHWTRLNIFAVKPTDQPFNLAIEHFLIHRYLAGLVK